MHRTAILDPRRRPRVRRAPVQSILATARRRLAALVIYLLLLLLLAPGSAPDAPAADGAALAPIVRR